MNIAITNQHCWGFLPGFPSLCTHPNILTRAILQQGLCGVKSEAQGNPWISDLLVIRGVQAQLVLLNQPAPSHVGCTRGVRSLSASISFTKKREKSYNSARENSSNPQILKVLL